MPDPDFSNADIARMILEQGVRQESRDKQIDSRLDGLERAQKDTFAGMQSVTLKAEKAFDIANRAMQRSDTVAHESEETKRAIVTRFDQVTKGQNEELAMQTRSLVDLKASQASQTDKLNSLIEAEKDRVAIRKVDARRLDIVLKALPVVFTAVGFAAAAWVWLAAHLH
jgi:hypothetical protein